MKARKLINLFVIISGLLLITYLIQSFGIQELTDKLKALEHIAPIIIFTLRATSIILPALPSTAYTILAGSILGFKTGLIVICIADITSCTICFSLSKLYGKKVLNKITTGKFVKRIEGFSQKRLENNFLLMIAFLMTGFFDFICYGIGLTNTRLKRFLLAISIASILKNIPIVALGAGLIDNGKNILLVGIIGIIFLGYLSKRLKLN